MAELNLSSVLGDTSPPESQPDFPVNMDKSRLQLSLKQAIGTDSHSAARAYQLSQQVGLPVDTVERNQKEIESVNRMNSLDLDKILKDAPRTAGYLSQPDNAKQAHDDVETLYTMESAIRKFRDGMPETNDLPGYDRIKSVEPEQQPISGFKKISNAFQRGRLTDAQGILGFEQLKQLDPDRQKEIDELNAQIKSLSPVDDDSFVSNWLDPTAEIFGQMVTSLADSSGTAAAASAVAMTGAAVAGQAGPQVAIPEELVTIPAAGIAGFGYGMTTGMGMHSFKVEAGHSYLEMLSVEGENGERIDPEVARGAAIGVGVVNAALEVVGIRSVTAPVKSMLKDYTKVAVKDALKNKTTRDALMGFAGNYAKAWGGETATEVMQEIVSMAGTEIAKDLSAGDLENMTQEEWSQRLYDTFSKVGRGMAILALPGASANLVSDINQIKKGVSDQDKLSQLSRAAQDSELKRNNADAFRELVKNIGEDADVQMVLVDPKGAQILFQGMKLEEQPDVIQDLMRDIPSAIEEGRNIEVPIETFATDIAGTEFETGLKPYMKLDPDALTLAESQDRDVQAEIRALASMTAEQLTEEAQVYNDVYGQLISIGQSDATASQYAMLHEAFFRTMSARAGVTPLELYNQYGLSVKREIDPALKEQARQIDDVDILLDRLRTGDMPKDGDVFGKSLSEFITEKGGLVDDGGELSARDGGKLIKKGGKTLDELAEVAVESGFIKERTEEALLEAIDRELRGQPVYALGAENQQLQGVRTALEQLQGIIDQAGIDLNVMDNDKVKQSLLGEQEGDVLNQSSSQEQDSNLFVTHNITPQGVIYANKLGGLAAPSLAVARADISGFEGFGEISLLADPSILETPRARTFDADIYTPRQPRPQYDADMDAVKELNEALIKSLEGVDFRLLDIQAIEDADGPFQVERSDALQYHFLKERGAAPKPKVKKASPEIKKASKLSGDKFALREDPKFIKIATDYYKKMVDQIVELKGERERIEARYFEGSGELKFNLLSDFAAQVTSFRDSKYDSSQLRQDIAKKFRNKKLQAEYEQFARDTFESLIARRVMFKGFTPSGTRKYAEYTLENVVREMTKQLQAGENFFHGAGQVRSAYAKELKTVKSVQKARNKIIDKNDMETIKSDATEVLADALEKLQPYYKYDADGFGYFNDAGQALAEGAKGVREAFEDKSEVRKIVGDLTEYLTELPTDYFEAKLQRSVQFSEFNTAVVPKNLSDDVKSILKAAGLKIRQYNQNDPDDRLRVISKQNDLLFQNQKDTPRGFFNRTSNEITLTAKADLSTFIHESAHFFLEVMRGVRGKDESIDNDIAALESWAISQGAKTDRDQHEMFASGFEAYLMEGKAPTAELQGLFSRFKSWLTMVYRKATTAFGSNNLAGVELSDEVRQVMDRLLATQEAIEQADQNMMMPAEMQAIGLNAEEAVNYQRMVNEARDEADKNLTTEIMQELMRERKKWWRDGVETEAVIVRQQVNSRIEYQVRDYLSGDESLDGLNVTKLDSAYIRDIYGSKASRKLGRMSVKGGSHPNQVATMFGYRSGDEMVKALLGTMNRQEREAYIKKEAEQRMRDLHGDMLTDGTLDEKAQNVLHNDKRADLLLAELRWLNRASGQQEAPRQYFKSAAEVVMSVTPVIQIRPDIHRRNEIKARNNALKAAAKGDYRTAALNQHQAVRQFYLYREASKAKTQAEKHRKRLDQISKTKYSARAVDPDYIQQIKVLVAAYDLRKNPKDSNARLEEVNKFILAQKESNPDLIADNFLDSITSWKEMTLDDLQALRDATENMLAIGKKNSSIEKQKFQESVVRLADNITANTGKPKKRLDDRSGVNRARKAKAQFAAIHRKLESLLQQADGWQDNGTAQELIFKPMYDAQIAELVRVTQEHQELKSLFEGFDYLFSGMQASLKDIDATKKLVDTYDMPVGTEGVKLSLTRGERIVLALNYGNEGNREALRQQSRMQMSDASIMQAISTLTKEELQLVNRIWEYVDKFYPELSKVEQEATGVAPKKVDADPFIVNGIEMRGGYYPLQADSSLSWKAEMHAVEQRAEKLKRGGAARSSTKHGSTIERIGFGRQAVNLSIDGLFKHVDGVVHDLTHRKAVREVDALIRQESVREALIDSVGQEGYKAINDALTRLAGGNTHPSDLAVLNKAMRFSRVAVSYGAMGYSVGTAILNMTGFLPAIPEVGKRRITSSLLKQMFNPNEMGDQIVEMSPFMANRAQTINRDVYAILRDIKGNSKWNNFKQYAFWMIQKVDAFVSRSVWDAAFNKALENGKTEEQAIYDADRTVARTQGTGLKIDLSAVEDQSEVYRALSPMYTYFNAVLNLSIRQQGKAKTGQISKAKLMENMFWIFIATAVVEEYLRGANDDEDEAETVERYSKSVGSYYLGQWFGIRELSGYVKYGQMFETPLQSTISAPIKLADESIQMAFDPDAEFDKSTLRAVTGTLPVLGFPSGTQINRTISYLMDIEESGEDVSIYKLLVTGKEDDADIEKLITEE